MTSTKQPKLIAISTKGKDLFWKYGIKRVSIEEICREAKVSKMTFYKFFPNKIALVHSILSEIYDESLNEFKEILSSNIEFTEKMKQLFILKRKSAQGISIELLKDINQLQDDKLSLLIEEKGKESLNLFIDFLIESQKNKLMRSDIKIDFVLFQLNQMNLIFENPNLVNQYENPEELIMESMRFLFYGLGVRDE
ncbi:TetR/AcrR family transcriptional regulator [Saccharicrinis aurantiacus]|uniref:TetR/AcrR family transcriptional regulator n=1 Tax=Saccharicrinis aurantiacus TaxID=1849719 RepID=UPI00249359A7|nr:TetR/AcrR family transcriptional regulator [Saccharicrinis aurantiacus]